MKAVWSLLALALLLACLPVLHATSVWNQARGSPQKSNSVGVNGAGSSCNIAWNTKNASLLLNCEYWGTFVTDGSRIFVTTFNDSINGKNMDGKLVALTANTGAVSWTTSIASVSQNDYFNSYTLLQQVVASPSAGLVFALADLDQIVVFNAATGSTVWSFRLPTKTLNSISLDDSEATLLLLDKYNLTAYSVSKRSYVWSTPLFRFDCTQVAVNTSANYVAVMCTTQLLVFRLSDGQSLWQLDTPEQTGLIALDARCIYAQYYGRSNRHGVPIVDCYDPQSGRVLWERKLRDEHDYRTEGGYQIGPIVTSKGVIVGNPIENFQFLLRALDPITGLDKWRYTHSTLPTTIVADAASVLYITDLYLKAYAVTAIPVGGTQAWNATFSNTDCVASTTVIGSNSLAIISTAELIKSQSVYVPTITLVNTNTANTACPISVVS